MGRIIIVQGDAMAIAFFNLKIPLADSCQYEQYKLTKTDRLIFSLGRKGRKPLLVKRLPRDYLEERGNNLVVQLTAEETARLPCLLYEVNLKLDIDGNGEEVYTLINQELEVVAK